MQSLNQDLNNLHKMQISSQSISSALSCELKQQPCTAGTAVFAHLLSCKSTRESHAVPPHSFLQAGCTKGLYLHWTENQTLNSYATVMRKINLFTNITRNHGDTSWLQFCLTRTACWKVLAPWSLLSAQFILDRLVARWAGLVLHLYSITAHVNKTIKWTLDIELVG